MEFWQNIVLKWKQIQQFCLWALSSDPSGLVESGLYYNTTANRAALRDDTKTQFLAHLEDTYKNAGVVKQPTITKGAGSVTVGNDAIIRCYKTTDYSGIIQEVVNPVGGTFALTENTELWLVYTYGVGYSVQTSITGPLSNAIPVYRFFNAFGVIHSSTQDEMGVGATEKILVKQTRTEYIKRVGDSGIELSTSALNVSISGGLAYNGPILETILPFNSATDNLYRVVYDDGVWSQTALHALTNTHYNPSTGLAALNSNKYCWAYVWRSIGDDVEALFQLGEQEYATEALAFADLGKMPANIYGLYATHCVLVGYVLIKQGVTTTKYFSAWGRPTVAGAPVYHNTLAALDGGDPATAYMGHAKLIDNTRMNAAGAANGYALLGADGKLPSGQLPSYVDDVLEYAAKASFPATGENGKIYVDLTTNLTWRWSGTTYVEISPSLALGETSATAYRGDRGKAAYDHSQITSANPHGTTASQIAFTPVGGVSAVTAQAAIAELDSEKLARDGSQTMTGDLVFQGVSGTNKRFIQLGMADNDYARITAGATADNAGFLEIATADDGTEPIYIRQYSDVYYTVKRTATLLDASGNTSFPGTVAASAFSGNLSGNASTASKLATARTITLTGGVSGSADFDGSKNIIISASVANYSHSHAIGDVDGLDAHLNARARTFSYKASSIDGINLWTLIASFSPSANMTYNFGISLSQAGSDFPWTNAPFDLYVSYRDGSFDVRGYFTTDRAMGDIYYGVVGGVVKVFLRNWSNWLTAYGGTILFDSHGVVNFASSTTTTPTGMTVYTPLERPSDTSKFGYAGGFTASPKIWKGTHTQYNALGSWDTNTIYMCYV